MHWGFSKQACRYANNVWSTCQIFSDIIDGLFLPYMENTFINYMVGYGQKEREVTREGFNEYEPGNLNSKPKIVEIIFFEEYRQTNASIFIIRSGNYSIYGPQWIHFIRNSSRNGHIYVHQTCYMVNSRAIDMCWFSFVSEDGNSVYMVWKFA